MRYFIYLEYDGTRYHGWQVQPNGISVQEVLQNSLSTLLRAKTEVVGAGRTDAGVHARMMVAHFDAPAAVDCDQLAYKLNRLLPRDVAVHRVTPVGDEMHARFSATSRTYHYYVHLHKSAFAGVYSTQLHGEVDFGAMNRAAKLLMDHEDFTSFSKVGTDAKTNLCRVSHAEWCEVGPGQWRFEISANRFLRNMVRAIVGTLLEVGRGRMSEEGFGQVIMKKDRCKAGESVPGGALFLVDVKY